MRWSHDVRPDGRPTSFHGDGLVADSSFVIGTDGGTQEDPRSHIYSFALDRGTVRWALETDGGIVSDIVRAGDRLFAITRRGELL